MVFEVRGVSFRVAANSLGLCEGGEIEAQMFNLAHLPQFWQTHPMFAFY
jgi:hypothetical protein